MIDWQKQHRIFISLLVIIFILVGLLAVRYDRRIDLTFSHRHELSQTSIDIVKQLSSPLQAIAFVRGSPKTERLVQQILSKYQQHAEIELRFENPDAAMDLVRQYQITRDGELILRYQGKVVHVADLSETSITRGIYDLLQDKNRHIVLLTGHGERHLNDTPRDFSLLKAQLAKQHIDISPLNLRLNQNIPDNTDVLVIADAQQAYSDQEGQIIADYISNGGQLLWLAEPDSPPQPALVQRLGSTTQPALLLNSSGRQYQFNNSRYLVITPVSDWAPLKNIRTMLLFPTAAPIHTLNSHASEPWQTLPFLAIDDKTYIKQGDNITNAPNPSFIGTVLLPKDAKQNQRVVIIGDSDFLSNQFIGQGENMSFALQLLGYLSTPQHQFIHIDSATPPPVTVSKTTLAWLATIFIIGVPICILCIGFWIRRRYR